MKKEGVNRNITVSKNKIEIDDMEAANFWDLNMLVVIDNAALAHFKDCATQTGTLEDVYLNTLTKYMADITTVF
jgi:hypothetical protein